MLEQARAKLTKLNPRSENPQQNRQLRRLRKSGRRKPTWWSTVETNLKEMVVTWGEAGKLAKDWDK